MIDLLADTRSTAFMEAAFKLLEIQSIRNFLIPSRQINLISINADLNENLYSVYAELPLTIVPNPIDSSPKLVIEDDLLEYTIEEYGVNTNIAELFASIALAVEIEESLIEDNGYEYTPLDFPQMEFDKLEYDEDIQWNDEPINISIEYFGVGINQINFDDVFTGIPANQNFYTDLITDNPVDPKNIESSVNIEEMRLIISATIPLFVSIKNQGEIKIIPLDYL